MTKKLLARWVKGTLVSAIAAYVSYTAWTHLRTWAQAASIDSHSTIGTGWVQTLVAEWTWLLALPILLWVGMRLLRERGNHALVLGGCVAWWFITDQVVEQAARTTATTGITLLLALFVLIGGLLSLLEFPTR